MPRWVGERYLDGGISGWLPSWVVSWADGLTIWGGGAFFWFWRARHVFLRLTRSRRGRWLETRVRVSGTFKHSTLRGFAESGRDWFQNLSTYSNYCKYRYCYLHDSMFMKTGFTVPNPASPTQCKHTRGGLRVQYSTDRHAGWCNVSILSPSIPEIRRLQFLAAMLMTRLQILKPILVLSINPQ